MGSDWVIFFFLHQRRIVQRGNFKGECPLYVLIVVVVQLFMLVL
jgi:hypothetical protein